MQCFRPWEGDARTSDFLEYDTGFPVESGTVIVS